ncbi:MAG: hypothetical protein IR527_01985 [Bacteroides sp.]|nr:MAG: hypothetical protein IR527_01985 [Bacteroides sp.]
MNTKKYIMFIHFKNELGIINRILCFLNKRRILIEDIKMHNHYYDNYVTIYIIFNTYANNINIIKNNIINIFDVINAFYFEYIFFHNKVLVICKYKITSKKKYIHDYIEQYNIYYKLINENNEYVIFILSFDKDSCNIILDKIKLLKDFYYKAMVV